MCNNVIRCRADDYDCIVPIKLCNNVIVCSFTGSKHQSLVKLIILPDEPPSFLLIFLIFLLELPWLDWTRLIHYEIPCFMSFYTFLFLSKRNRSSQKRPRSDISHVSPLSCPVSNLSVRQCQSYKFWAQESGHFCCRRLQFFWTSAAAAGCTKSNKKCSYVLYIYHFIKHLVFSSLHKST